MSTEVPTYIWYELVAGTVLIAIASGIALIKKGDSLVAVVLLVIGGAMILHIVFFILLGVLQLLKDIDNPPTPLPNPREVIVFLTYRY